jgi:hypothetical protein
VNRIAAQFTALRYFARTCPATQGHLDLVTSLPRLSGLRQAATLSEIVQIYAIRNWIEPGYKQVKDQPGGGRRPASRSAATGLGQLRVLLLLGRLVR